MLPILGGNFDGVLADRGMAGFSRNMDARQAEEVRAYVAGLSDELAKNEAWE